MNGVGVGGNGVNVGGGVAGGGDSGVGGTGLPPMSSFRSPFKSNGAPSPASEQKLLAVRTTNH